MLLKPLDAPRRSSRRTDHNDEGTEETRYEFHNSQKRENASKYKEENKRKNTKRDKKFAEIKPCNIGEMVHECKYCGSMLFLGEMYANVNIEKGTGSSLKQWCCGEGRVITPKIQLLPESIRNDPRFKKDCRTFNNLFAFSALGIDSPQGKPGFVPPPGNFGVSVIKIQGRAYHRIMDVDWKGDPKKDTNNTNLYINDELEREKLAEGRKVSPEFVKHINTLLHKHNPFVKQYRVLAKHSSETAHLVFERTTRKTHGPILGDAPTSYEIAAIISTSAEADPRQVVIWKKSEQLPRFVPIESACYEPLQYPLLFFYGEAGWDDKTPMLPKHGKESKRKKKDGTTTPYVTQTKYYRNRFLTQPQFTGTSCF